MWQISEERVTNAAGRVLAAKRLAQSLPRSSMPVIGCAEHEAIRRDLAGEAAVPTEVSTLGE